jgi:hypothetical protein
MEFCERNELDAELAAMLTKLYLAIHAKPIETPDYDFTEAEIDSAVDWFNIDFYHNFKFPAPPRITDNTMPFSDIDNDDLHELFPKNPKNYDIAYDEDGEWSYYRGEWLLSCPAGHNPLDYPMYDDYDDPRDID